jgi:hypothetical protein
VHPEVQLFVDGLEQAVDVGEECEEVVLKEQNENL